MGTQLIPYEKTLANGEHRPFLHLFTCILTSVTTVVIFFVMAALVALHDVILLRRTLKTIIGFCCSQG